MSDTDVVVITEPGQTVVVSGVGMPGPPGPATAIDGSGLLTAANNLSDLTNTTTALENLGFPTGLAPGEAEDPDITLTVLFDNAIA